MQKYDIIVIGGGHAGVEAALAAARMGNKTLMLCTERGTVSLMPCNPSIGGTAKGHLVREIDALGGQMALSADAALLQIKMLNSAKGPAVYSLRGQEDKKLYHEIMLDVVSKTSNLTVADKEVVKLIAENGEIKGVLCADGETFSCRAAVLATGVYLNGKVIIGEYVKSAGPGGFKPANHLSESLKECGIPIRRFKTGTPARIYRDSIDYSETEIQRGENTDRFSFMSEISTFEEEPCYLTYTNAETHKIIMDNISRSPLYNGNIKSIGPRYCPSIETKVMLFSDKERHQIFIEPEGKNSDEMYIQGMSSSLPHDVQEKMYRTMPGLRNCRFAKYAYAIEYDCIDPTSLMPSLETKAVKGLFSAGQTNGSSGYEEAAAQGLIAGINASLKLRGVEPLVLRRDEAYIGVLIDDLVTKGTNEPYRMMTSRAEHRIMLRQDNADLRLTEKGYALGLASKERLERMRAKKAAMGKLFEFSKQTLNRNDVKRIFAQTGEEMPEKTPTFGDLCRRPEISKELLKTVLPFDIDKQAFEAAAVELKYEGYLKKQESAVAEQKRLECKLLPEDIEYSEIKALRLEARQKLNAIRPLNLGQASRISGVSPADIAVLIVYLEKKRKI